jgi:acetylornithine/succinyldiaminopimelate/putrescine aminotransferase
MPQAVTPHSTEAHLARLEEMRVHGGPAQTGGLADTVIEEFLAEDRRLALAIERAYAHFIELKSSHADFLALSEADQVARAQEGLTSFYAQDAVNPYVAAGAAGPWVVSLKGAVIYDCGGYGMLGLGHAPEAVAQAMDQPHVMANVMTASVSQIEFIKSLRREIGHTREGGTPYASFLCLNSGSEAMTLASRIADANTKRLTDPGGRYEGCAVRGLTLKGSFHGRTDRPARFSSSTRKTYTKHLASFSDCDYLLTVEPNDIEALEAVFAQARKEGIFIEAFLMEPVMGEGNPGLAIEPDFYARARELTREHGTMLVVDSIQAGLRAHGVLSIVDYPGFETLDEPDMESYSKALNAGQFPLSVLAFLYPGPGTCRAPGGPVGRDQRRSHRRTRHGVAAQLRARFTLQGVWREQHRRAPAQTRPGRDPRRRTLFTLHARIRYRRQGSRPDRGSDSGCVVERAGGGIEARCPPTLQASGRRDSGTHDPLVPGSTPGGPTNTFNH